MELTNSRIEIGVLVISKKDGGSSIDKIVLDLVHNGCDSDVQNAIELFLSSDPPEVTEFMLMIFCMSKVIRKEDGEQFLCVGGSEFEKNNEWKEYLN